MMDRVTIAFAECTVADLEELQRHYAEEGVPEAGSRPLEDILTHVEKLARFPDMGCVVPEFGAASLREIVHPPFRIVYRRDGDCCRIAARRKSSVSGSLSQ